MKHQKEKDRIDWRRRKVQELTSQGHGQREIAGAHVKWNCNRDLSILAHLLSCANIISGIA
jgi:hypothetical protein